jgi:hypothetical protein
LEITVPAEFFTTTEYVPECRLVTLWIAYEELVAPEMFEPFLRHWYVRLEPEAETAKFADWPDATETEAG